MTGDQLSRADLKTMSDDEIVEAADAGRLDALKAGQQPRTPAVGSGDGPIHRLIADLSGSDLEDAMNDRRVLKALAAEKETAGEQPASEPATRGSADIGARGEPPKGQLGRSDLKGMSDHAIAKAYEDGRLSELMDGARR